MDHTGRERREGEKKTKRCIPFLLGHARVDTDGRKIALHQELIELCGPTHALYKYDNLIEVKSIQQIIQLPVLLHLAKLDIVLHMSQPD